MSGPRIAQATGRLLAADGVVLYKCHWSVEEARAGVLLLHGFGDHVGRYRDLVRTLSTRGYSVFAYDQRGHGASEGPRGHADRFDLFLSDLDQAWSGLACSSVPPLFLYGHSFGGLVAMRWLQTRPYRPAGVVLSAPWLKTAMRVPRWKLFAARVLLHLAPSMTIPSGANDPEQLTRDPARIEACHNDPFLHHAISSRFHADALTAQEQASTSPLPSDVPVLLVLPGSDSLVDASAALRWAQELGGRVEVRTREGGRHELHNDIDRERVLGGIADWLDAHTSPNP